MKKDSKKITSITPLGDRVLIKPLTDEEMGTLSPSGIIIPETVDREKTDRGKVVEVGSGKKADDGTVIPVEVKKGDTVLFQWGEKVEINNEEYYIVGESSILAILND